MFIAMNRFKVIKGCEEEFEAKWKSRDSHLNSMKGFMEFHLLRGPEAEDHTLYSSHTTWATHEDFVAWTNSQAFRDSHKNAGDGKKLFHGHPQFEGFQTVQTLTLTQTAAE